MAVTDQIPIGGAVGNGVTTVFPFAYYIGDEADLVVQRDGVNATLNVDYVVSGAGNQSGGQIAFVTAPANGVKVTHFRNTSLTRATDYQDGGDLQARTVNLDFDRLWFALQEIFSGGKGSPTSLRVPAGEVVEALPKASERANMALVFDSTGRPIAAVPVSGSAADVLIQLASSSDVSKGDALIGVKQPFPTASATTQHRVNRRIVSLEDFGAIGDGTVGHVEMLAALQRAFDSGIANRHDLWAPPGVYDTGTENFPWKNPVDSSLLDCGGLTIWCAGPKTVFRTTSVLGADVLQLNALQNFRIMGFPRIEATVTGSVEGSNACSITNGYDNLQLQIDAKDMPCIDTGTVPNGGAALTMQNGTTANPCGRLVAEVIADGCRDGFGFEPDLVTLAGKTSQVDVFVTAKNCYIGVKYVAAPASGALPAGMTSGLRVRGTAVNCQHPVLVQRAHGVDIDITVNSTKTALQKRYRPGGSVPWLAIDGVTDGAYVGYAKDSFICVRGFVGAVDYKVQLGAAAAGLSGLNAATETSEIDLDLGGTAALADINALVVGGTSIRDSRITLSANTTTVPLPADLVSATNANRLFVGANYTGTFTATLNGCTTTPTATARWSLNGDVVTLEFPDLTGTSNSTAATITGLPAAIQPAASRNVLGTTVNNGADAISRMDITGGTVTLYNGTSFTFTNTGTKGIRACSLTYRR